MSPIRTDNPSAGMASHFRYSISSDLSSATDLTPMVVGQKRRRSVDCYLSPNNIEAPATKQSKAIPQSSTVSPTAFVLETFRKNGYIVSDEYTASIPFTKPSASQVAAYQTDTVKAARSDDVEQLRTLYRSGVSFDCCNRFGESLISMACRRGNVDIVRFLVREAHVSLLIRDDFGRTVLHDAFWTKEPNIPLVEILLEEVPDFLWVRDVRGHTPLDYVRREHWDKWIVFLNERRHLLHPKVSSLYPKSQHISY